MIKVYKTRLGGKGYPLGIMQEIKIFYIVDNRSRGWPEGSLFDSF